MHYLKCWKIYQATTNSAMTTEGEEKKTPTLAISAWRYPGPQMLCVTADHRLKTCSNPCPFLLVLGSTGKGNSATPQVYGTTPGWPHVACSTPPSNRNQHQVGRATQGLCFYPARCILVPQKAICSKHSCKSRGQAQFSEGRSNTWAATWFLRWLSAFCPDSTNTD